MALLAALLADLDAARHVALDHDGEDIGGRIDEGEREGAREGLGEAAEEGADGLLGEEELGLAAGQEAVEPGLREEPVRVRHAGAQRAEAAQELAEAERADEARVGGVDDALEVHLVAQREARAERSLERAHQPVPLHQVRPEPEPRRPERLPLFVREEALALHAALQERPAAGHASPACRPTHLALQPLQHEHHRRVRVLDPPPQPRRRQELDQAARALLRSASARAHRITLHSHTIL
jgi:hypothetical protein